MRILVSGLGGAMGREVAKLALAGYRGAELVGGVSPHGCDEFDVPCAADFDRAATDVDCVVDFSHHSATEALFGRCRDGVAGNVLEITGSLYALFGALLRCRDRAALDTPSTRFGQKAEQLKPALEYIETHYGQGITLEALARLGPCPEHRMSFGPVAQPELDLQEEKKQP